MMTGRKPVADKPKIQIGLLSRIKSTGKVMGTDQPFSLFSLLFKCFHMTVQFVYCPSLMFNFRKTLKQSFRHSIVLSAKRADSASVEAGVYQPKICLKMFHVAQSLFLEVFFSFLKKIGLE